MESSVLNAITIDLAEIEVRLHFDDVARWDAVGGAVDAGGRFCRLKL